MHGDVGLLYQCAARGNVRCASLVSLKRHCFVARKILMTTPQKSAAFSDTPRATYRNTAPYHTAPWTTDERLQRIVAMNQQITGYIEFLSLPDRNGTSEESREKAVAAFYERMAVLERQLARIHDDVRLG